MKTLTLDDALIRAGEFGNFQKALCSLLFFAGIEAAFHAMTYVFWAAKVGHHCMVPVQLVEQFPNISLDILTKFSIPWEEQYSTYSKCSVYERDYGNITENEIFEYLNHSTLGNQSIEVSTKECSSWLYDTSQYTSTIVTKWDLVCDRAWLASATQSAYLAGMMIGGFLGGLMADRFGRRPSLIICGISQAVLAITEAFLPNVYMFIAMRCLSSTCFYGMYMTVFVLMLEMVGPSWREFVSTVFFIFWAIGYMMIAGIAYFIRSHFWLLLAVSLPLLYSFTYLVVPESPRWLIANGNKKECIKVLRIIAKWNKNELPEEFEVVLKKDEDETSSSMKSAFIALMKSKVLVKRSLIMIFLWISNTIVYYGLSLNTSNLGGNDYINFAIFGGVEIFSYIAYWFVLKYLGRRLPLASIMLLCGIALFAIAPIPKENYIIIVTLAMFGKFAITMSFAVIYVYSAEIFPTMIRVVAVGTCNIAARLAGVFTPYIVDLAIYNRAIPMLLMGSVAFIAGVLTLFLPETHDQPLPKTVEAAEKLGENIPLCWCRKKSDTEALPSAEKEVNLKDIPQESIGLMEKDKSDSLEKIPIA